MNNRQKALCLKIRKHRERPEKAAMYFAALIGSGARPEDLPEELLRVWKRWGLRFHNGKVWYGNRAFSATTYWRESVATFPELNLPTEMRFHQTFVGG